MVSIRHATLTSELAPGAKISDGEWDAAHDITGLAAGDVSGLAPIATSGSAADLSAGTVPAARMPALTGDVTTSAGAVATTLATVNGNVGSFGSATQVTQLTVNAKGLVTAAANVAISIAGTAVANTPAGNISAVTVQAAIDELDTEKQPADATLTAFAGLAWSAGSQVPVMTAADTVGLRSIGAAGATDILDRAAGDARYALSAAGVSDGDKGDITVSSSGTVWTVDDDAITYAKMQNVSATDKVLGRSTAGSGDVEEIACTAGGRAVIGLTYAADKVAYSTSASAAATTDLTSVARTLIGQTTQALMRTTGLGLGTSATVDTGTSGTKVPLLDGTNTWSAQQTVSALMRANYVAATGTRTNIGGVPATYIGVRSGAGELVAVNGGVANVDLYIEAANLYFQTAGANTRLTIDTAGDMAATGAFAASGAVTGSNLSGTNTGDQTITLTGDVTGSGTGSFAATIKSSVALAGSPTTTTQSAGDNSTKIATTAYARAAAPNASYRTILDSSGSHTAAKVAGTYGLGQGDPLAVTGTGTLYPLNIIYIDSSDYPSVDGLSTKLRIRANLHVNDVAPTGDYTIALHPVTRPATSGGAGLCIYTIGAAVASSGVTVSAPAADSSNNAVGSDFALPANGYYVVGVVTTQTVAASSHVHISASLQMRNA